MFRPEKYVKDILLRPSERDRQKLVGASNISNACTRCLAEEMAGLPREQGVFNMGAIVGTAVHDFLDRQNLDPDACRELKMTIGEIPGYGVITSTSDLVLPTKKTVLDYKTCDRAKLEVFKKVASEAPTKYDTDLVEGVRATLARYYRQALLYGLGATNAGFDIRWVGVVFLARDGKVVDQDVWAPPLVPYDPELAQTVFERACKVWAYIDRGEPIAELQSAPQCYYCNVVRLPEIPL